MLLPLYVDVRYVTLALRILTPHTRFSFGFFQDAGKTKRGQTSSPAFFDRWVWGSQINVTVRPENPTFSYCRSPRALLFCCYCSTVTTESPLNATVLYARNTHTRRTRSWEMRTSAKAENVSKGGRLLPVCVLESRQELYCITGTNAT